MQTYVRKESNRLRRVEFERQRRGDKAEAAPVEETEDSVLRALAATITAWRTVTGGKSESVVIWGDERLECTPENVQRWLKQFKWVRVQIDDQTSELANFIGRLSKASPPSPQANLS